MNFTLALLGGLVLILPGLAAVTAWQIQSGQNGVRRAEIALTSILALVLILAMSLIAHFVGWAFFEAGRNAWREVQDAVWGPTAPHQDVENPYDTILRLEEKKDVHLVAIINIAATIAVESALAAAVVWSKGLNIAMDAFDAGNQGWVFQNIMRPTRHGMKPLAYVLTNEQRGAAGLGYRGVVVEARQGHSGELQGLTLASPDTFTYEVASPDANAAQQEPRLRTSARRRLEGVLSLEASSIRNVLIQVIPDVVVDDIVSEVPALTPTPAATSTAGDKGSG